MSRRTIIAVTALAFATLCATSPLDDWRAYKLKYEKHYTDRTEDHARFVNFMSTKQKIDKHNAKSDRTFDLGVNQFSDLHAHELDRLKGVSSPRIDLPERTQGLPSEQIRTKFLANFLGIDSKVFWAELPEEFDWRTAGNRVTEVKNQKHCGSCWAFSITGLLEGQEVARNLTKSLVSLSEQDLVDCSDGCSGGWPSDALRTINEMGGIDSEADYPYEAKEDKCRFQKSKSVLTVSGGSYSELSDAEMKQAIVNYGPLSASIAVYDNMIQYKSGVYEDDTCTYDHINHAVLIVGYGTDKTSGLDYWLVKNCWSETWGEKGYLRIVRGKDMCGINHIITVASF